MSGSFNEGRLVGFSPTAPAPPVPYVLHNVGIAAVAPSYFLHDILFSDELKQLRADHPIGPQKANP